MAACHAETGDLDKALAAADEAIRRDAGSIDAYVARGSILEEKGAAAKALRDLDEAVRLVGSAASQPGRRRGSPAPCGNSLGERRSRGGPSRLEREPEIEPAEYRSPHHARRIYCEKGDLDRALADLDKALDIDPKNASAADLRDYVLKLKQKRN